ncbi:MAG: YdcF family protein [Planctomycetaceae bacterium]|nr:YdcF family protein [Planctomycetaceae bacterium]
MARKSGRIGFLLTVAVIGAVVVGTVWILWGRPAAEKIATNLILPAGVVWWFTFFSAIRLFQIGQRRGAMSMLTVWVLYTASGSGYLSDYLVRRLESPFLSMQPLEVEPLDAVIVLGGGGSLGGNRRPQANGSGDRLVLAAQMYHAKKTEHIICTGRRIAAMDSTGIDPSDVSAEILKSLGVPAEAIEQVGGQNTSEELHTVSERFPETQSRIGVITSAWHMPRVLRLAKASGVTIIPLPADFRTSPDIEPLRPAQRLNAVIPSGDALQTNGAMLKEFLATIAGR